MTLTEFNQTIEENSMVVAKFGAEWCGPCKTLDETLKSIEPKYPQIKFIYIDVEDSEELTQSFRIRNVPIILFFVGGKLINKTVGAKSETEIQLDINNIMKENIN